MSRHGKISDDKIQISVLIPRFVRDDLKKLADEEGRTLSQFTCMKLTKLAAELKTPAPTFAPTVLVDKLRGRAAKPRKPATDLGRSRPVSQ
jgi:hypothetical protein